MFLAAFVSMLVVAIQFARHVDRLANYHRDFLPGFDAYVYVAMAEEPTFFTVAPWGYRVLAHWLVSVLPFSDVLTWFAVSTLLAVTGTGVLLYVYFRRLGHRNVSSLLAVAAFGLSPPVSRVNENPFLTEPLTILLLVASCSRRKVGRDSDSTGS